MNYLDLVLQYIPWTGHHAFEHTANDYDGYGLRVAPNGTVILTHLYAGVFYSRGDDVSETVLKVWSDWDEVNVETDPKLLEVLDLFTDFDYLEAWLLGVKAALYFGLYYVV